MPKGTTLVVRGAQAPARTSRLPALSKKAVAIPKPEPVRRRNGRTMVLERLAFSMEQLTVRPVDDLEFTEVPEPSREVARRTRRSEVPERAAEPQERVHRQPEGWFD